MGTGASTRKCDIVMKGGITSGVVYPSAVVELARLYRFQNVGGASAGAIAAAATAAAEHARQRGRDRAEGSGFGGVAAVGEALAAPGALFDLFAPDAEHAALWRQIEPLLRGDRSPGAALVRAFEHWGREHVGALLVALALGAGVGLAVGGWASLVTGLGTLVVIVIVAAASTLRELVGALSSEGWSLCRGMGAEPGGSATSLTPWLTTLIDQLAGRPANGAPLTFGDLWGDGDRHEQWHDASLREVNLEVMTTNLSQGRPHRIPFDADTRLYFSRRELLRLFPARVVEHLVTRAAALPHDAPHDDDVFALPPAWELPVVVAARMSLSFPLLVSAVPLRALRGSGEGDERRVWFERVWFTDGGVSSNFPIHFFDALLPRWPTFGIDLAYDYPDGESDEARVRLTRGPNEPLPRSYEALDDVGGWARLLRFAGVLVDTMKGWQDGASARLPGFRDRIALIRLRASEGGLNLSMTRDQVRALSEYGREAGRALGERFASAEPRASSGLTPWQEHRFTRFRSGSALLERLFLHFRRGYDAEARQLAQVARVGIPPHGFKNLAQAASAEALATAIDGEAARLEQLPRTERLQHEQPLPAPLLRVTPRVQG